MVIHHESSGVELSRVRGDVVLFSGSILALGGDGHTVTCQPDVRRRPGDSEGCWTHLGEVQTCGPRNSYRERREHNIYYQILKFSKEHETHYHNTGMLYRILLLVFTSMLLCSC